jgi:hypothetical protein
MANAHEPDQAAVRALAVEHQHAEVGRLGQWYGEMALRGWAFA